MTLAAAGFAPREQNRLGHWGLSLLIVLALHAGLTLLLLSRRMPIEMPVAAPPAVMIDLAPMPAVMPPAEPEVQPAPPEPPPPEPPPPEPEPPPVPELTLPPPKPIPPPHPVVTLPKPPPKPKPLPRPLPRQIERPPPPPPVSLPAAPLPAAPVPTGPSPAVAAAARASWQAQLAGLLSRHKRYPRPAQEQRQQGTAYLRFAVDRGGRVLSFHLDRSSGFPLLDEEVLALIQRAQPLPPPPAEVAGDRIELVVPVAFSIQR